MNGLLAQKARLRLWTDRALSNVVLSNVTQHLVQRTQEVPEVLRCLQPTPSMTSSVSAPSRRKHFAKHGTPTDLLGFPRSRRYWKLRPRGQPFARHPPAPGDDDEVAWAEVSDSNVQTADRSIIAQAKQSHGERATFGAIAPRNAGAAYDTRPRSRDAYASECC